MIEQGFTLMLYGIGSVFLFLGILVLATTVMSTLLNKFMPADVVPQPMTHNAAGSAVVDQTTLRVIQAAISQHRSR